ncbi:DUF6519 domain-containing protein, partial [Rivularia sp. UHCC 0363]|uniref:DUF6519 domain-containing protein n=1 Tax=Rivularia sp. UHCC 0363 TaxID=3110244 RepID=UPI002B1F0B04
MKGDFTRFTFKPQKHYTSVLMQQGRVQLDADWNEQADIHAYFNQSIAQDMIGVSGAVKGEVREGVRDSFQISTTADADHHTDLIIAPGHFYVDGILCELDFGTPFTVEKTNNPSSVFAVKSLIVDGRPLEAEQWVEILDKNNQPIKKLQINTVDRSQNLLSFAENVSTNKLRRVITYKTQPDYPQALQTDIKLESDQKPPKAYYITYLDVWQRHITAIEDTNIREVALNGNDTTTRTQTVWQVKLYKIPGLTKEEVNRELAIQKWQQDLKTNHSPVYLTAKIKEGNQNWDNQLYRIEIHQPGKLGTASFKWSKNNGSTVFPIKEIVGNQIGLNNPSRDASQSFTANQWVEITDDALVLQGKPGTLVQLKGAVRDKLTFDPTTVEGKPIDSNYFPQKYHPKVTAWDGMTKNATVSIDGIEVNFSAESEQDRDIVYRTGDYWLIPTRKVKVNGTNIIGDFGSALPQTPAGIEHHYSPLALLYYDGNNFNLEEDLRSTFAPLSRALDKAGGIITGKLEIQNNLYITGKNIPTQDNTGTKFIPGKVRIGTEISQNGKHLLAEPDARLHLQGTPPTSLSVEPSENGTIKVSTDSGEKLKVGDTITINPLNAGNPLTSIVTQVENDNSGANKQSLKVSPEFTAIPTSKFSYQQPIMLLADYENNPKIIVNSQGNFGIGTNIPHQKLVINNGGKVGIGYNEINQSAALAIKGNVGIGTQNPDPTAKLEVNGNIKITGDRLKNADNRGIVDTTNQDWLNINPDSDYPGIALYNPVAISSGLAIGELIKISEGELKVNKNAFLAVTSGKVSIGTPQQKRDNTLLEVAGSTIIGSSYINSKTAQENGLLVEGKVNIGGTPEDNQQAKDAQLYTKGDAYIDGEVYATDINITGSRIKSADLLGIIETNAKDWLRVNPDSAYPGIALYNPVAISKGGLAIGKLTQVSDGQLQVSNSAFLATTSGKVSIGTPQEPSGNTLLEVAGSTIIGSSYINSKAAPE